MGSASYTKGAKRVGGNHEWVGMNHEIHERREREIQNHEWTRMARRGNSEPRMDTNGTTKYRSGTTKHTKNTKKGRGESMNHERHERHERIV